jgi:hypothetical protein
VSDRPDPGLVAAHDQMGGYLRSIAQPLAAFRRELEEQGFHEGEAYELVEIALRLWLSAFFAPVRGE